MTNGMHQIKYWILAFRPKTLTAALVPIFSSTALVWALGYEVVWWVSIVALLASLFIQIGTNLVNDAEDFRKGADTASRIGPKRVTQSGVFSVKQVHMMAALFFLLAIVCGVPLVIRGGWPIFLIGIFSVLCGYAYTKGPFPLAYKGMGDFFVILFFGVIAVVGLFYLHTGSWIKSAVIMGLQVGFHCAVLIAINNLRDIEGDVRVNKKTLPVRFGKNFARWEIAILLISPFLLQFYWIAKGFNWVSLSLIILPLAVNLIKQVFITEPSPEYNKFLAKAAAIHLIFGVFLSVGLIL